MRTVPAWSSGKVSLPSASLTALEYCRRGAGSFSQRTSTRIPDRGRPSGARLKRRTSCPKAAGTEAPEEAATVRATGASSTSGSEVELRSTSRALVDVPGAATTPATSPGTGNASLQTPRPATHTTSTASAASMAFLTIRPPPRQAAAPPPTIVPARRLASGRAKAIKPAVQAARPPEPSSSRERNSAKARDKRVLTVLTGMA